MENGRSHSSFDIAVESLISGEGERRDRLLEWHAHNPPDIVSFPYAIEEIGTDFRGKEEALKHILSSVSQLASEVLRREAARLGIDPSSLHSLEKFFSGRENSSGSISLAENSFWLGIGSSNILPGVKASACVTGFRDKDMMTLLPASYRLALSAGEKEYDSKDRNFRLMTGDHGEVLSVMLSDFYINYLRD